MDNWTQLLEYARKNNIKKLAQKLNLNSWTNRAKRSEQNQQNKRKRGK